MNARDDYPLLASYPRIAGYGEAGKALDEIDCLRAEVAAFRDLAGCCSDCEWEGAEIVHRPMCARWVTGEIAEAANRVANGIPTCGATWRDTEAQGWLWYCSLASGHDGRHRCIGATW